MIAALAFLLIGLADLARTHAPRRAVIGVVALTWALVGTGALVLLSTPLVAILLALVIGGGWLATTTTVESRRPPAGVWPALALAVVFVVLLGLDSSAAFLHGPLVDAQLQSAAPFIRDTPLRILALAIGAAVFLVESGNIITRAALYRDRPATRGAVGAGEPPARRWWTSPFSRARATTSAEAGEDAAATEPDLRGGRAIGPLERLAIAGLVLVGAYAIVGAVLAGKGIVRFPEISKDSASGSKAEYFLVGSLVSWTIALATAAYIALSR